MRRIPRTGTSAKSLQRRGHDKDDDEQRRKNETRRNLRRFRVSGRRWCRQCGWQSEARGKQQQEAGAGEASGRAGRLILLLGC